MSKSQKVCQNRFGSLDFLKFILALIIVFHHYQQMTGAMFDAPLINFYNGKVYFGFVAEFFFIVSGFLVANTIEKTRESDFGEFIIHKLKRIYPMVTVATLFNTLVLLGYPLVLGESFKGLVPSLWRLLNSLLLTFAGGAVNDVESAINHATWYMGVLIICYVIFWIILYICRKDNRNPLYFFIGMCLLGVSALQYNFNLPFLNEYSGRGYSAFFWGIILNYIYKRYNSVVLGIVSGLVVFVCAGLGIVAFDTFYDNIWGVLVFLIFPGIMFVLLSANSLFKSGIWKSLGEVSFEIYIWHSSFIIILCAIIEMFGVSPDSPVIMIAFALVMTILGFVIRRYLEKPVVSLFSKL